MKEFRFS